MNLEQLLALGFDASAHAFGLKNRLAVACSQCQSTVINGTPCHERGCPHEVHECAGCNALVPRGNKYCPDCR